MGVWANWVMNKNKLPNKPGIYTLIIDVIKTKNIHIGGLGIHRFLDGIYTYTGSALGKKSMNLRNRLYYHASHRKQKRWHIDYFLESNVTKLKAVIFAITNLNLECVISKKMMNLEKAQISLRRFGSSDCKRDCQTHLYFFNKIEYRDLIQNVRSIYQQIGYTSMVSFEDKITKVLR